MLQSSYSPLMRITSLVVVITFAMLILEPTAIAAQVLHEEHQQAVAETAREETAQLTQTLKTVETTLTELQAVLANDVQLAELNLGQTQKRFKDLKQQVLELDESVQIDFDAVENHLRTKKMPDEILQRHQTAVTTYRQHLTTLLANLEAIIAVKKKGQLHDKTDKALKHLKPLQTQGKHPHFDPNNLPFSIPDGKKVRPPLEDEKELKKLFPAKPIKVAATTLWPEMLTVATAPDTTYLQATTDVQITPEIEALAQELEHNPVKIYNWVHDHIQFIPTYGSIQGSQLTLETKNGNAVDTASLLIALLRASGIHSRYAYGTVRIPIEKVMNWVGGVTAPEAAVQLLAQGGIPTISIIQGGQIKWVKMEQVWVEAWIDFFPSRGAKHVIGETWVPMDASFKQYEFTDGIDIQGNVPFDTEGFVDHIINTAQINETEGWVSDIDQTFMETQLSNYQTQMEAYLNQINPEATIGEVLGSQSIIPSNRPVLATGLPYPLIARGSTFKELPSRLRHRLTIKLYDSLLAQNTDMPSLSQTLSLSTLGYQRLGMTYVPSTETDAQALAELAQSGAETLPAYLFNLKPILKLDETELVTGSSIRMGEKQYYTLLLSDPETTYTISGQLTAGDEIVFGLNGNGVTHPMLLKRLEKVSTSSAAENLHMTALHYWLESDLLNTLLAKINGLSQYRLPSVGLFSSPLSVESVFGIPKTGSYKGRAMDIKHTHISVGTADQQTFLTFMMQAGLQGSYLESSIFEQLFPGLPAVSATQFLATASQQGIPIFKLTNANISTALPLLAIDHELKQTLSQAVQAGNWVIIPQQPLTIGQYTGIGYVVQDPITGSGAYMIDGGFNGGRQASCQGSTQPQVSAIHLVMIVFFGFADPDKRYTKYLINRTLRQLLMRLLMSPIIVSPMFMVSITLTLIMVAHQVRQTMRRVRENDEDDLCFRLVTVGFHNDIAIYKDEVGQAPLIEDPVWKDHNGDGLPETDERVGYVSGNDIKVKATFKVKTSSDEPVENVNIKVENVQSGLQGYFYLGNVIGQVSTDIFFIGQFQGGLTQYFSPDEPLELKWSYSTDGSEYRKIGVSKHTVYVTLQEKLEYLNKVYLTLLHLAASVGGATTKADAVEKTWSLFANPTGVDDLKTWDNRQLYYYGEKPPYNCSMVSELLISSSGNSGECGAFANLLVMSLWVNNISAECVKIYPLFNEKMLINNWEEPIDTSFPGEFFPWKYEDLKSLDGIPGQNMATPSEKVFLRHYVISLLENSLSAFPFYDPSYGTTFYDEYGFEKKAVFGYLDEEGGIKVRPSDGLGTVRFEEFGQPHLCRQN